MDPNQILDPNLLTKWSVQLMQLCSLFQFVVDYRYITSTYCLGKA
jgi:hypothetical protein